MNFYYNVVVKVHIINLFFCSSGQYQSQHPHRCTAQGYYYYSNSSDPLRLTVFLFYKWHIILDSTRFFIIIVEVYDQLIKAAVSNCLAWHLCSVHCCIENDIPKLTCRCSVVIIRTDTNGQYLTLTHTLCLQWNYFHNDFACVHVFCYRFSSINAIIMHALSIIILQVCSSSKSRVSINNVVWYTCWQSLITTNYNR